MRFLIELKKYPGHYVVLGLWLALGMILFNLFGSNDYLQLLVVQLMATGYFIWGLVHHLILNDLKGKIVLEYLIVAVLAALLIAAVIWRK